MRPRARVAAAVLAAAAVGPVAGVLPAAGIGPAPAAAQELVVELRGGAAVGSYTGTGAGLDPLPEAAFGGTIEYWPAPWGAAYVSFTRASFGCEDGFCTDRDVTLTSQGLVVGGRWARGALWARGGLALHGLRIQARDVDVRLDQAPGLELGAGLELPLGGALLRPGLTYLRHGAEDAGVAGHAAVLAAQLGVAVRVPRF